METYESVKSNPVQPEQKEKKKGGAWKGIVAVILAAGVVGSTTISAFNLVTLKSYIAEQKKEENPETTEDYVRSQIIMRSNLPQIFRMPTNPAILQS